MDLIYVTIIAFLNSIDNIGFAVVYSMSGKKVPIGKNLLISTMAFAVSYVSALFGGAVSTLLSHYICTALSVSILVMMGIRMIIQSVKNKDKDELENYNVITNKEAITVGILLALDDVGSSVSSGLIGFNAFVVSMPFFIISFVTFFLANYASRLVPRLKIGNTATAVSGAVMILMGVLKAFN